jgi:hypothetical protein
MDLKDFKTKTKNNLETKPVLSSKNHSKFNSINQPEWLIVHRQFKSGTFIFTIDNYFLDPVKLVLLNSCIIRKWLW